MQEFDSQPFCSTRTKPFETEFENHWNRIIQIQEFQKLRKPQLVQKRNELFLLKWFCIFGKFNHFISNQLIQESIKFISAWRALSIYIIFIFIMIKSMNNATHKMGNLWKSENILKLINFARNFQKYLNFNLYGDGNIIKLSQDYVKFLF